MNRAYDWCKTAKDYASKLIAVEVRTGNNTGWACLYQKGDANGMQTAHFNPQADGMGSGDGTGTVVTANHNPGYVCLQNEVRRIDFNRMISFFHSIDKFSCLIS